MRQHLQKTIIPGLILILISSFFWAARIFWLGAPYNSEGFGSLGNAIYAVMLIIYFLILSGGLGEKILNRVEGKGWTSVEKIVLSLSLGLGSLSIIIFGMGLIGLIKPVHFIGLLILIGIFTLSECKSILKNIPQSIQQAYNILNEMRIEHRLLCIVGLLIITFAFLQSLTPPFDYDGLMYHLQGPRLFLDAGRIQPIYESWFTFYPFSWEMIYMLGLGLGSDVFARLIHFTTFILILASTYSFGCRFLPKPGGWLAAAILLGIPVVPLWSAQAYTDLAQVLFQFLAVVLFLLWTNDNRIGFLVLSGIMQGFAIGNKYLAFSGAVIIGMLVLITIWQRKNGQKKWEDGLLHGLIFGGTALVIASPWLIKNLVWTGNPVFPFYFSANGLDPAQLKLWFIYVQSFGVGKEWYDYLLLPINLYSHHGRFGTWFGVIDIPSPFFLFTLIYVIFRQHPLVSNKRNLDFLALISLFQFASWALGSQQTRFLLPIYPGLCILSSHFLLVIAQKTPWRRIGQNVVYGSVTGVVITTCIVLALALLSVNPLWIFLGQETRSGFLRRMINDQAGVEFVQTRLPASAKVMMLWDGRGYYCDQRCIPDMDQARWVSMVQKSPSISDIKNLLVEQSITHLFLSKSDAKFFVLTHDPERINQAAVDFLQEQFAPACTRQVFQDEDVTVFEFAPELPLCQ